HERAPDVHHAFLDAVFLYWTLGLASWLIQQRIPARDLLLHADAPVMPYQELDHLFGVPIRFEAPLSCLVIDAQWLAQPVLADAPSLQEFLRAAPANLLVRYRDRSSDSEQVRLRLHRLLGGVLPSLEQMAWSMKMTPHSLRRRLFDEGKSFQGIKNDLRRDAAIDLLTHSSLTLADIAQQLGFSEPSTFHRSFKLWTGVAPGEYRQTHGGALAFSASANHRR
ncbi:MAG: helix-turn-helix domain-containing protein, partial [Janthinobacterium lividum]